MNRPKKKKPPPPVPVPNVIEDAGEQEPLPPLPRPSASQSMSMPLSIEFLEEIRTECFAEDIAIDVHRMSRWTEAEAKRGGDFRLSREKKQKRPSPRELLLRAGSLAPPTPAADDAPATNPRPRSNPSGPGARASPGSGGTGGWIWLSCRRCSSKTTVAA